MQRLAWKGMASGKTFGRALRTVTGGVDIAGPATPEAEIKGIGYSDPGGTPPSLNVCLENDSQWPVFGVRLADGAPDVTITGVSMLVLADGRSRGATAMDTGVCIGRTAEPPPAYPDRSVTFVAARDGFRYAWCRIDPHTK